MFAVMIGVALAMAPATTPGPDSPVCEPGQVSWVDACTQPQLPEEQIGRQIDGPGTLYVVVGLDPNGSPVLAPAPSRAGTPRSAMVLAHTGVPTGLYAITAGVFVAAGAGLLSVRRRLVR